MTTKEDEMRNDPHDRMGTYDESPVKRNKFTCRYSYKHAVEKVPAVTTLDCGPVGDVPACQVCADFYNRNK